MHLKQRHPHLRVLLSIGGRSSAESFPLVTNSGVLRDNFARSARGPVEASGLDGIDGMYRYPVRQMLYYGGTRTFTDGVTHWQLRGNARRILVRVRTSSPSWKPSASIYLKTSMFCRQHFLPTRLYWDVLIWNERQTTLTS